MLVVGRIITYMFKNYANLTIFVNSVAFERNEHMIK